MHKFRKLTMSLSVLCTLSFVLFAMAFSIERVAYDNNFYDGQMRELGVEEVLGVNGNDLHRIIDHTVAYIKGEKDDFQLQATIHGQTINVYQPNEIEHMKDVQNLFALCGQVKWVCLTLTAICLVIICALGGWQAIRLWGKTTLWTLLAIGILLGIVVMWVLLDFHSFWTIFHKLSFRNELWMMRATDRMIQMFPAEFFATVVMRICMILSSFVGGLLIAAIAAVAFIGRKRGRSFG